MGYLDDAIKNFTDGMEAAAFAYPDEYIEIEGVTDPNHVWADMESGGALGKYFEPWKALPDGSGLNEFMTNLTDSTKDMVEAADIIELEDVDEYASSTVSPDIPARMASIRQNVSQWQGYMIDEFRKNYSSKFDHIVFFQSNLANILRFALQANRDILAAAQADVADVVNQAGNALAALDCSGGDDSTISSSTVTATTGVMSLIGGPLGVIAGFISLENTLDSAVEYTQEQPSSDYLISGDTVYEIWDSLLRAFQSIENTIFGSERRIADVLDAVFNALDDGVVIKKTSYPLHQLIRPPAPSAIAEDEIKDGVSDNSNDGPVEKPEPGYERPPDSFETES